MKIKFQISKFFVRFEQNCEIFKSNYKQKTVFKIFSNPFPNGTWKMWQKIFNNFFAYFQYWRRYWSWNTSPMNFRNEYNNLNFEKILHLWKQTYEKFSSVCFYSTFDFLSAATVKTQFKIIFYSATLTRNKHFLKFYTPVIPSILRIQPSCTWTFFLILTCTIRC